MSYLSLHQRVQRLRKRIEEQGFWEARATQILPDWQFNGADFAPGTVWPTDQGVVTLTHGTVNVPSDWPLDDVELELDAGGEGLVCLTGGGNARQYGLDPYHTSFPLPARSFSVAVQCVARLPFGVPSREPKLSLARLVHLDRPLRAFNLLLLQIAELVEVLGGHEINQPPREPHHPFRPRPDQSAPHEVCEPLLDAAEAAIAAVGWPSATNAYVARVAQGEELRKIWALPGDLDPHPPALDEDARASVAAAMEGLEDRLLKLKERYPAMGRLALSGHAHIDLAWLWPLEETERKVVRTFHTAVDLMNRYDRFRFNQSTAHYYDHIARTDPDLLARIRQKVAAGQWEPIGAMWVEPDTNMPTGESFVRQLLYGIRYFDTLFGPEQRSRVAWLPDCFGFSPALPQLYRQAGIDSFFTHKTNWNEKDRMRSDLFWWEGIDGSRVLVHTNDNPEGGYNGRIGPRAAIETWRNFQDKSRTDQSLLLYGWGDGGGGPTRDQLDRIGQASLLPVMPELETVHVGQWYGAMHSQLAGRPDVPVWQGEIYLQYHRGTLTTQGRTKRLHRQAEQALVGAEVLGSMAHLRGGAMPTSLEPAWRTLLHNQFHDILPGSSIREVYERAETELQEVVSVAEQAQQDSFGRLLTSAGLGEGASRVAVVNTHLHPRPVRLHLPGDVAGGQKVAEGTVFAPDLAIGGLTLRTVDGAERTPPDGLSVGEHFLENRFVRVVLNHDGTLAGVLDKRAGRECLDGPGNRLVAYVDKPRMFDAWDIEEDHGREAIEIGGNAEITIEETGPHRVALRVARKFRDSAIVQHVRLWANSPRIDIRTEIDWHERKLLLKALFPVAVRAPRATYECAYGVVDRPTHRNTSWDQAQFEVAAHRFVDLSEHGFGVALLNDGRYGHHVLGNEMGISLLRSPVYPDPLADEGRHSFTYAILPHEGDWQTGDVLAEAEDLNRPMMARTVGDGEPVEWTAASISGPDLALSAIKPAEDGKSLVLRVHEAAGGRGRARLSLPEGWRISQSCNLLEESPAEASYDFTPFQVRSWHLIKA